MLGKWKWVVESSRISNRGPPFCMVPKSIYLYAVDVDPFFHIIMYMDY